MTSLFTATIHWTHSNSFDIVLFLHRDRWTQFNHFWLVKCRVRKVGLFLGAKFLLHITEPLLFRTEKHKDSQCVVEQDPSKMRQKCSAAKGNYDGGGHNSCFLILSKKHLVWMPKAQSSLVFTLRGVNWCSASLARWHRRSESDSCPGEKNPPMVGTGSGAQSRSGISLPPAVKIQNSVFDNEGNVLKFIGKCCTSLARWIASANHKELEEWNQALSACCKNGVTTNAYCEDGRSVNHKQLQGWNPNGLST